jgi:hypothetical protein
MRVIYESDGYGRIENLTSAQADALRRFAVQVRGLKFHDFEREVDGSNKDPESVTLHFYCRNKSDQWKRVSESQFARVIKTAT